MSLVAWFVLGLAAGMIAHKLIDHPGRGIVDAVLGAGGAVTGGWLFTTFGVTDAVTFELYSLLAATVGAVLVVIGYHALSLANAVVAEEADELPRPFRGAARDPAFPVRTAARTTGRTGHPEVFQRFQPESQK